MRFSVRGALLAALFVSLATTSSAAFAQSSTPETGPEYEARLRSELKAKAPNAIDAWEKANAEREAGHDVAARDGYVQVIELAPDFDAAHRRLCGVEPEQAVALTACRKALGLAKRWENHAALASRLLREKGSANESEAAVEIDKAAVLAPQEPTVMALQAEMALEKGDLKGFEARYGNLVRWAPESETTLRLRIVRELVKGDTDAARKAIARAKAKNALPPDAEAHFEKVIDSVESQWTPGRIAKTFALAVGLWLAVIFGLFGLGSVLSRATLRHTDDAAGARDGSAVGGTRTLKRIYSAVITVAGVVYWLSLPFVAVLVIGAVGAVIYASLAVGRVPVKLILIAVLVGASSVWALMKSVFIALRRGKERDPGELLVLHRHPRLATLLSEVSARVGTRNVDAVFLTSGTDMAVYERGGAIAAARGRAERCLVVGAGVLRGFRVGALKGVLAHEFGHFKNEDTAGGAFSLSVRRSMLQMLISLLQGGAAAWYNPAWLFATKYHHVFLRISQGASRLQEVLADRWAITAYGSTPFIAGFEHVIRRSIEHDAHVQRTIEEVTSKNYALANLFTYVPETPPDANECEKAVREALEAEADEYDSHPPPKKRIELARALHVDHASEPGDDGDAWELLNDRDLLEARLTDRVRKAVAENHSITIRRAA